MAYPDMPAAGVPIALVQQDFADGNGAGGVQTVTLAGADQTNAGAPRRIDTLGGSLAVVPLGAVGGTIVDLPVTAGAKTTGTVLGDAYELPGPFGALSPPFGAWDLVYATAIDYSAVIDASDLELWFFQHDPGFVDGDTFDLTYADLLTKVVGGPPVLLDTRADTASSRTLTAPATARRPIALPSQQGYLVAVVRGAGFTLPADPHLAIMLQLVGIG